MLNHPTLDQLRELKVGSAMTSCHASTVSWLVIMPSSFADAILDRLVHNAYRLALDGPSMRKLQAEEALAATPAADSPANTTTPKPAKGARK